MYTIFKTGQYLKDERKYRNVIGHEAFDKMEAQLSSEPTYKPNRIKKLTGYYPPYRYQLADFRVLYDIDEEAKTVILHTIKPRGEAYKK